MKKLFALFFVTILSCALVAGDDSDANAETTSALTGDQNTSVLHGHYIWKSQGFITHDHLPFVEAGQWPRAPLGIIRINVDGTPHYHHCSTWCGGTYNIN